MKNTNIFKRLKHALNWRTQYVLYNYINPCLGPIFTSFRFTARFFLPRNSPHGLPGLLIVSLTSYPPRYPSLLPTLKCLLTQSMRPDLVILWVTPEDAKQLPNNIIALKSKGLEIRKYPDDLGPYKKIIPTLQIYPDAFIVTADDDIYYERNWLKKLVQTWTGNTKQIVCHRAHKITLDDNGIPKPYTKWEHDISGPTKSAHIFPTGVGGVLYPPGCFSPEVLDTHKFMQLSPKADDVWLYFMARQQGCIFLKTPGKMPIIDWKGSQEIGLLHENLYNHANDQKITNMIHSYGWT